MRNLLIALLTILILLLLGFGAFAGYRFVTMGTSTEFTDIVLFVMALVGLLIALASIGIWTALRRILHEDIAREISQVEEATRNEALSRIAARVADSFWAFYEKKRDKIFREQAITMIGDARTTLEGRVRMEKEELKCRIYNNLAFALAERGETKDTALSHFMANYIKERINDFPEEEIIWLDTYAYVLYMLPKKHDDKKKALDIVNELLERPDIKDKAKREYRRRYSLPDVKAGPASNPDNK